MSFDEHRMAGFNHPPPMAPPSAEGIRTFAALEFGRQACGQTVVSLVLGLALLAGGVSARELRSIDELPMSAVSTTSTTSTTATTATADTTATETEDPAETTNDSGVPNDPPITTASELPNLVVGERASSVAAARRVADDGVTRFVANVGAAPAGAFTVHVQREDGTVIWKQVFERLEVGDSQTLPLQCTDMPTVIMVDVHDDVREESEDDNSMVVECPAPEPEPEPERPDLGPSLAPDGETYSGPD